MDQILGSVTRRKFLSSASGVIAAAWLSPEAEPLPKQDATLERKLSEDPMRPQFHLLPAKNWMNDPNGPIYFAGKYHMFFQYNPYAAVWGNMTWNHAVSSDMLHWTHCPIAFTMTPGGPDAAGCFSGSTIAVEEGQSKRVYAVYTGVVKSQEMATVPGEGLQESQCLAWSDDEMLEHWTKQPQPILPLPPAGMKVTGFRDPSAWRKHSWFYMTVGSGVPRVGGCVLLYRSKDLRQWEYLHELTSGEWNGHPTPNPCADGEMWECPEFFPLDGGHVLIYSTLGKVFWQSGVLDEAAMKFKPSKTGLLDLGAYYAPKTQLDAQGRRILWGWIQERRTDAEMRAAGWSGMMSLPRVLNLDKDGTLRMQILPQTASLRSNQITPVIHANETTLTLKKATGEVLCSGTRSSALEFTAADGTSELLRISYAPANGVVLADGKEIQLQPGDIPEIHAFVDGSVIETIVSQRIGFTKRFYYAQTTAPDVQIRVSGADFKADAWKITPISNDRLTTPAAG